MYWQAQWKKPDPDQELKDEIVSIRQNHPNYGYRRIHATLVKNDFQINRKKVQRICQELKIQVKNFGRKYRKYNSYKGVVGRIAPNCMNRRFESSIPHQKITTDTTEFKYYEEDDAGKLSKHVSKRDCYDDAPIENFFGVMKQEMCYGKVYRSYKELENAITEYIRYYNEERIKEKLHWLSPAEYRKEQAA